MGLDFGYPRHHHGGMSNAPKLEASADLGRWEPLAPEFVCPKVLTFMRNHGQNYTICSFDRRGLLVTSAVPASRRKTVLRVWIRIAQEGV